MVDRRRNVLCGGGGGEGSSLKLKNKFLTNGYK